MSSYGDLYKTTLYTDSQGNPQQRTGDFNPAARTQRRYPKMSKKATNGKKSGKKPVNQVIDLSVMLPAPVERAEVLKAALAAIEADPDFEKIDRLGTLVIRMEEAQLAASKASDEFNEPNSKHADVSLRMDPLHREYREMQEALRQDLLRDPGITKKRAIWENFPKKLEAAVLAGLQVEPRGVELANRLRQMTAEADALRTAKAEAQKRAADHRELYNQLLKEADELKASIL